MDALSAIGLASNVVQLITFSTDLITKSREIHRSASGSLIENVELETIARSLLSHSRRVALQASERRFSVGTGKELLDLSQEARRISQDLIDTIEGLKADGPSSKWKSFYQALKSVWKEQDIADYLRRLELCRRQIDSLLLMHLQERLELFTQTAEDRNTRIEKNLAKLLESVQPESKWQGELLNTARLSLENAAAARDLDTFSAFLSDGAKQERDRFLKGRILESLKFADMRDRYETISEAHRKTFDWVFNEKPDLGESDGGWDSFVDWVRSNKPLYWMTGKPGAGKSTLMKCISDDRRLMSYLKVWERDKPISMAKFFLWNSGSAMQMSRIGMMQSLLYQPVSTLPEEIPRIFAERWEYFEYFGFDHRPWSWVELSSAFKRMVDDSTRNFFFLIDGLDEFDGDCEELANFLLGILAVRSNVKMCLASRPWLVFEDAFRQRPSLRMEDLTLTDIKVFTSEGLGEHPMFSSLREHDPEGAKALIDEVTQKSAGVFLWVRLVVKSLLEGLRDGDTMKDLQARLLLLPQDLEALFQKILGDLEASYFEEASKLFQTVRASHIPWELINLKEKDHLPSGNESSQHDRDNRSPLALLSLSFALEDVELAFSEEYNRPMDYKQRLYRGEVMRRRLASRCKGLLEVPSFKKDGAEAKVQYLHRTVKDFFHEANAQVFLSSSSTTPFDACVALCAALIRHTKAIRPSEDDMGDMEHFEGLLKQFVTQCHWIERQGSSEYVRFLDEMNKVTVEILGYDTGPTTDHNLPHWTKRVDPYIGIKTKVDSLVDYAFERRLNHYLLAKLECGYVFVPTEDSCAYLLQRAEKTENGTLVKLLETYAAEKPYRKRESTSPMVQETKTLPHDLRDPEMVVSKVKTQEKQGIFGFRKDFRDLFAKHLSSR